jgi:carboxyl-terminal processing protease
MSAEKQDMSFRRLAMLERHIKIPRSFLFLAGALIALLLAGLVYALTDNLYTDLEEFNLVATVVRNNYVEEINPENLVKAGITGMLSILDPYSEYLDPKQQSALMEDTRGQFEGLGIEIAIKDGWLTVISPLEDTPAERLGIQAGDRITRIEGVSTEGITAEEAVSKLRGKKGTVVHITIEREGIKKPMEYAVERDVISIRAVPYYGLAAEGIGYVRLNRFSDLAADEVKEAVSELKRQNVTSMILDLRGNPGGLLSQAVDVAGVFLGGNELVVSTKGRVKNQNQEFYSLGQPLFPDLPLVVLVDQGSASGAEIVAGAIQDWDRGLLVGDTTFGKGLVQNVIQLSDGSGLKLTTAKYLMPSGRSIQRPEDLKADSAFAESDSEPKVQAPDSTETRQKFFTKGGRVVYGGGGVAPDVYVPYERLSPLEYSLLAKRSFLGFAVHYAAGHPDLPKDFQVDDAMFSQFEDYLKSQKFEYQTSSEYELDKLKQAVKEEERSDALNRQIAELEKTLEADKQNDFQRYGEYIKSEIKENLLVKLYGPNAKYQGVWFTSHPQIVKAIQILSHAGEYQSLLSAR